MISVWSVVHALESSQANTLAAISWYSNQPRAGASRFGNIWIRTRFRHHKARLYHQTDFIHSSLATRIPGALLTSASSVPSGDKGGSTKLRASIAYIVVAWRLFFFGKGFVFASREFGYHYRIFEYIFLQHMTAGRGKICCTDTDQHRRSEISYLRLGKHYDITLRDPIFAAKTPLVFDRTRSRYRVFRILPYSGFDIRRP